MPGRTTTPLAGVDHLTLGGARGLKDFEKITATLISKKKIMLDKLYMYIMCRFATGKNVSCLPVGNNILALSKPSTPPPSPI